MSIKSLAVRLLVDVNRKQWMLSLESLSHLKVRTVINIQKMHSLVQRISPSPHQDVNVNIICLHFQNHW